MSSDFDISAMFFFDLVAVAYYIKPVSFAVYLRMQYWKKHLNWSTFAEVITQLRR